MTPFLHAPIAWAAIGLASIPIIIHLLNRRRLRRIEFAAMEFLLAALRKNKRRVRVEQLILLACRVLLMLLLAFFLARPLLDNSGFGWLSGALSSEDKIFVVDDSMSMAQTQTDRKALDRASGALVDSLHRIAEKSSRDRVTVLRSSRPDAPLVRGNFLDRDRASALEVSLEGLATTSTSANLAEALEAVAELLAKSSTEEAGRPRSISILTDLRAIDWTDGSGGADAALATALERLTAGQEIPPRLVILDVGSEETTNLALDDVTVAGGRPTVGIPAEIRVVVRNWGSQPMRDLRVRVSYAPVGAAPETASMALAPPVPLVGPGESVTVSVATTFRTPGQYWGEAEVSGAADSIAEDNSLSFVLDVVEATEVLVVNGEPSSEPFEGESDFLATALRPSGEASSGFAPEIVIEDNIPRGELGKYGAIFLCNVYQLPPDFVSRVGRYVRRGGPLVIFLGDQVDPVIYERQLGVAAGSPDDDHPGRGILPAKIGEVLQHPDAPVGFEPSYEHRYFQFLKDGGEKYVQETTFEQYFELEPEVTSRTIATFDDGANRPAIVERTIDAGLVLLFASSADTEWNDWPQKVTFLPVVQELMRTMSGTRTRHPISLAGTPIEVPLDITLYDARGVKYRSPGYPRVPERDLIASPRPDDLASYRVLVDSTWQAGLATMQLGRRSGEPETRAFAIRSDPTESNLQRIRAEEIRQLYPDVELTIVRDPSQFSETGRGRFEIADVLIGLFILFLCIEGVLACWFAHHKRSAETLASTPRRRVD